MELFKTVPAYSWLFIYFRKYWDLRKIVKTPLKKVWLIWGLTVYKYIFERRALH